MHFNEPVCCIVFAKCKIFNLYLLITGPYPDPMFTWEIERLCKWLEEIGIDGKYAKRCRAEEIDGKSLLCLMQNEKKIRSVLDLKAGPWQILLNEISAHKKDYDKSKLIDQSWKESGSIESWNTNQLVNWLRETGLSENYVKKCEEEEINGKAFDIMSRDEQILKGTFALKEGPLAVLVENVQLYVYGQKNVPITKANKLPLSENVNVKDTEKSDIAAASTVSIKTCDINKTEQDQPGFLAETRKKTKEDKLADTLTEQLHLQFQTSQSNFGTEVDECTARLIYFQTGASGNSLENMFQFIVVCKGENSTLSQELGRKLWKSIRSCTLDFMTLLTRENQSKFVVDEQEIRDTQNPSKVLQIRDGKVTQVSLEKIGTKPELKDARFVLLVDNRLISKTRKTYYFQGGKKFQPIYFSIDSKDAYHATFNVARMDAGLQWSDWFINHKQHAAKCFSTASLSNDLMDITKGSSVSEDIQHFEDPREFDTDTNKKTYRQSFIFNSSESGTKDLMRPMHEFKLFTTAVQLGEEVYIRKFIQETLRFACACLNERSNGTIHFGIADQEESKAGGHRLCEIIGVPLSNQALFDEKLKEYIGKCFNEHSIVRNCIRPPLFVPVKSTKKGLISNHVIEVDIVPSFSFCSNEVFKVTLPLSEHEKKSEKRSSVAYIRDGANSRELQKEELELMLKERLPKLDKERNRLEQRDQEVLKFKGREENMKYLFPKLQRLLCAGSKTLDCSIYPVLVLTKPDETMDEAYLHRNFKFISKVNWLVVVDFDNEGSKESNLCRIFTDIRENTNTSPLCNIHEAEDFESDDNLTDNILNQTCWIFANGYSKLGRRADDFKQWRSSKRKRGITEVIKCLSTEIPKPRIVVVFVLLCKAYEAVADIFAEFCTYLDGPNQLLYVAESHDIASSWETQLCRTCLEEDNVSDRGVVGMSWTEFQDAILQMITGIDSNKVYLPMSAGGLCPLKGDCFTTISVLSAIECTELENLNGADAEILSYEEQINFYRGNPVSWKNYWFTDQGKDHVLKRDKYNDLKDKIELALKGFSEQRVQTVNLFYQVGAGASTLGRHVLWDLRNDIRGNFRCRCAVVNQITDMTCTELFRLRKIGYSSITDTSCPPVLVLVENVDDILFKELRSQVIEQAVSCPKTSRPVCVFLYCKSITNPYEYSRKEANTGSSVTLRQLLSTREMNWFKAKFKKMEQKFKALEGKCDPDYDFAKFATDNLISFMLMKENFNPQYTKNVVKRNLDDMTRFELNLLTNLSLLNVHDPHEVFAACFDSIMLSDGMKKKNLFRNWMNDLTPSARVFIKEIDRSEDYGTGKAIAIVHPIIASEILDEAAERTNASVGDIALAFLKSDLFKEQAKYSFPLKRLRETTIIMLKHRKKFDYGDDEQTKFSPLIEKILHSATGSKQATKETVLKAAEVLKEGLDKFKDPIIAQQIARVFYVNAKEFGSTESNTESCFDSALVYGKKALEMNPSSSFILDTMGRIFESKLKLLYGYTREENKHIEIENTGPLLKLASEAVGWFQKSQEASKEDQNTENKCGFTGELAVMFYLLDVLRCVNLFRNQEGIELLRRYLTETEFLPPRVAEDWKEFHPFLKSLEERYICCIEELIEEFSIFKENTQESRALPRAIARFKFQYLNYFGRECLETKLSTEQESWRYRWEYRWQKINQYLAGDLFNSVFNILRADTNQLVCDPRKTLNELRTLVEQNFQEPLYENRYKDFLLMITLSLSLHSPYGPDKFNPSKLYSDKVNVRLIKEYQDIYRLVEKLRVLEIEKPETRQRIYGRFFKVMFLWPRKEMELGSSYNSQEFYDSLNQLQEDFESKRKKGSGNVEKWLKQNVHKKMTFKDRARQYTTLFYLGNGRGLNVFVHKNELPRDSGKPFATVKWDDSLTRTRLQRWTGTIASKNLIKVKNPLDPGEEISLYYTGTHERQFSKEEVSFYIGFSWARPIALDVRYTREELEKEQVVTFTDEFHLRDIFETFRSPKLSKTYKKGIRTYDDYIREFGRLQKKLREIHILRNKKRNQRLEENEVSETN